MPKAKSTTVFFCNSCGYESSKWMGQCPGCKEWNTFTEEPKAKSSAASGRSIRGTLEKPVKLTEISSESEDRISTHIDELDRVLGGGIVPGSLILVGGDPGIGKSTLLLQVCKNLSDADNDILYVSGEESLRQIKMRAERIGKFTDKLSVLCETNLSDIETNIRRN